MRFFFNEKPITPGDWLAEYKDSEFESPTRSTVPLLDALRREPPARFLGEMLEEAGVNAGETHLHLEYQVEPGRGRGMASHTDVMAIDAGTMKRALAIEAKWTEPRYETVADWLSHGKSAENRRLVLQGWLDRIAPHAGVTLVPDTFGELIYQMVHRAASACEPGGIPAMMYLVFQADGFPSHLNGYRADLQRFRSVIGNAEGFPFFLATVKLQPTAAFRALEQLPKGDAKTGDKVRKALSVGAPPLFDVVESKIETV